METLLKRVSTEYPSENDILQSIIKFSEEITMISKDGSLEEIKTCFKLRNAKSLQYN